MLIVIYMYTDTHISHTFCCEEPLVGATEYPNNLFSLLFWLCAKTYSASKVDSDPG